MTHGQVLIWQARDDERYMHALHFEKEDLKKKSDSVFCVSFVFRWVVGRGKYYSDGPNDGYPVEKQKQGESFLGTSDFKTVILGNL
jgi:hypothetical protein